MNFVDAPPFFARRYAKIGAFSLWVTGASGTAAEEPVNIDEEMRV